jgi:lipopolysaccharide biosynthesis glycosyltransferase
MEVHLAIGADRNIEVGLHVTLYTALKFLNTESSATIHLFLKDFSEREIERLHQTLSPFRGRYDLKVYDANKIDLGSGRSLYSSKMPYISLVTADLIDAERVLFLDADLLVLIDISEIFSHDLDGKTAGVVSTCSVAEVWFQEYGVLKESGLLDEHPYFSSGVILFDAQQWKSKNLTQKCFDIIGQHGNELRNTDQTVLNAALCGDVCLLPENYHRIFYAGGWSIEKSASNCICHLGGAPKPWDFLGEFLNHSYPAYQQYLEETSFHNYRSYLDLSPMKAKRTLLLSRSYYLLLKQRIKNSLPSFKLQKVRA